MPIEPAQSARTLRLALGTSLAFGAGQLFGWQLAFLVPILALLLLKLPQPPTLRSGVMLVLVIAGAFALALVLALPLLHYPVPAVLVLTLALFWTFLFGRRGGSPFAVVMMLIALTLVPVMGLQSIDLSLAVAGGLAQAGLGAVLFAWIAFAVIPAAPPDDAPSPDSTGAAGDAEGSVRMAWLSTMLVAPLLALFLLLGLSSYALVLVFVTLLAMEPDLSTGIRGGLGLIAGNALGGVIAVAVYEITVIHPNLLLLTLLIALVCLVLGQRIFTGGTAGALCGTALSTVLLIVGMTVAPIGPEADVKFYSRIVQIMAATLYIALALWIAEVLQKRGQITLNCPAT